jgi:uncharacterized RDD family membrane protein YckC
MTPEAAGTTPSGPPADPFAPPASEASPFERPRRRQPNLADRGRRLGGAVIDGALYAGAMIPGAVLAFAGLGVDADDVESTALAAMLGPVLVLYAGQMYLVTTTGQTLAKRWLSMRIVRTDGRPVDFVHGVVLRSWVLGVLSFIPGLGNMISLADAVCIFGQRQQCVHDLIAETKVVDA